MKKRHRRNRLWLFLLLPVALVLSAVAAVLVYGETAIDYSRDEALFTAARERRPTVLYCNQNGDMSDTQLTPPVKVVGYNAVEYARLSFGDTQCYTPLSEMPDCLKNAAVAIEDHRFYEHDGVDMLRTARAAANTLLHFEGEFGASTITQQLIKNLSGDNERTAMRKMREIFRAVRIEDTHTKDEILELYLNILPLGDGCVGVGTAAEHYFGKTVSALTASEAASLIAVTNAPARYNPRTHPDENRARRDIILGEMLAYGYLSDGEYKEAIASPVKVVATGVRTAEPLSWYAETVIEDLTRDLMEKKDMSREAARALIYGGGLSVYTLVDTEAQAILERVFSENVPRGDAFTYAMTLLSPQNGDLLAIVGNDGEKKGDRLLNYANSVKLPPGSALKPLSVYAPALEEGVITWSSIYDDTPVSFDENGGHVWPHNANRVFDGLCTAAEALARSKNTVAVRILRDLGIETSYHYLTEKFGLRDVVRQTTDKNGKSVTDMCEAPLALGQLSYGVTLRDLTAAYTAFADSGNCHTSRSYLIAADQDGQVLIEKPETSVRVLSRENAAIMTEMLRGVTSYGTGRILTSAKELSLVGKTGTAGNGEQRFFIGYTPEYLAGIYCGIPTSLLEGTGNFRGHAILFDRMMTALYARLPRAERTRDFYRPYGIRYLPYCKDSGKLVTDACALDLRGDRTGYGWFLSGTEPQSSCETHIPVLFDGDCIAHRGCLFFFNLENLTTRALLRIPERALPPAVRVRDDVYVLPREKEQDESNSSKPHLCPHHERR